MGIDIEAAAWDMMKGRNYQNAKCDYGSTENDTETFSVKISMLQRAYRNDMAGIADGEMRFRRYAIIEWTSFSG
jgi:hypothetical protein